LEGHFHLPFLGTILFRSYCFSDHGAWRIVQLMNTKKTELELQTETIRSLSYVALLRVQGGQAAPDQPVFINTDQCVTDAMTSTTPG
jgi:hypothetical protein